MLRGLLLVLSLAAGPVTAQTFTTVLNNGPASNRVDIVFIGDGYTAANHTAGAYTGHVNNYLNYMFSPGTLVDPFPRYAKFFNAHAVRVDSVQSGCDIPQSGIVKNTALDATYRYDGTTDRLLYFSDTKANAAVTTALAGSGIAPDMRFGIVNESVYGGGGGTWAVYAGGNASARDIAMHEMGHSFSNLADEYGGFTTPYTGGEPSEVNVTRSAAGKWPQWNGYVQPGIGTIGAYNGGRYYDSGIYRPSNNSKMRALNNPFDAVGREKIILDIYAKVRPLDAYTSNAATLVDPASVSVTPVDEAVIDYQWFVDGVLVPGQTAADFTFGPDAPGLHTLRVRAYDPTGFDPVNGWVRINTSLLEQNVTWSFSVIPEPLVLGVLGLALVAHRRRIRFGSHNSGCGC